MFSEKNNFNLDRTKTSGSILGTSWWKYHYGLYMNNNFRLYRVPYVVHTSCLKHNKEKRTLKAQWESSKFATLLYWNEFILYMLMRNFNSVAKISNSNFSCLSFVTLECYNSTHQHKHGVHFAPLSLFFLWSISLWILD